MPVGWRDIGLFLASARSDKAVHAQLATAGQTAAQAFDALYAAHPDPWRSGSSRHNYQRRKYEGLLAFLPPGRRFASALDIGCGAGFFTERLAPIADQVLGLDISAVAAAAGTARCTGIANLQFAQGDFSAVEGQYDLVVLADTLYYLHPLNETVLAAAAARVARLLAPGGICLLANHYFAKIDPDSRLTLRIREAFLHEPGLALRAERRRAFWLGSLFERQDQGN